MSHQQHENFLEFASSLVKQDLDDVNTTIHQRLNSDIALINTLGQYIIQNGGKRLRPIILLLCARCGRYQGKHHVLLAAVIEFIHTATLLHDDVVDSSTTRRSQPTANHIWGNAASILVGDFLYSRSFEMMVETQSMAVMDVLASTTNAISEGEVLQLLNANSPETSEQQYMDTIQRKTAKLFEAAAQLGAILADQNEKTIQSIAQYGLHLGTAFQLVDDILDYSADSETLGKEIGDDLAEGKPTLPLIHALELGTATQKAIISDAIKQGSREKLSQILEIIDDTGALQYTQDLAEKEALHAQQAIASLPDNDFKTALEQLAKFSVIRKR